MRPFLAILVLIAAACSNRLPTAPSPAPASAAAAATDDSITITSACPAPHVWDFTVDGAYRGLWLMPTDGRLALAVDSARGVHPVEATRWDGEPTVYDTTLQTGGLYALPCAP